MNFKNVLINLMFVFSLSIGLVKGVFINPKDFQKHDCTVDNIFVKMTDDSSIMVVGVVYSTIVPAGIMSAVWRTKSRKFSEVTIWKKFPNGTYDKIKTLNLEPMQKATKSSYISSLALTKDGNLLVFGFDSGFIRMFVRDSLGNYVPSGCNLDLTGARPGPNNNVSSLAVVELARRGEFILAAGFYSGLVKIFTLIRDSVDSINFSSRLMAPEGMIHSCKVDALGISPDGSVISSSDVSGEIKILQRNPFNTYDVLQRLFYEKVFSFVTDSLKIIIANTLGFEILDRLGVRDAFSVVAGLSIIGKKPLQCSFLKEIDIKNLRPNKLLIAGYVNGEVSAYLGLWNAATQSYTYHFIKDLECNNRSYVKSIAVSLDLSNIIVASNDGMVNILYLQPEDLLIRIQAMVESLPSRLKAEAAARDEEAARVEAANRAKVEREAAAKAEASARAVAAAKAAEKARAETVARAEAAEEERAFEEHMANVRREAAERAAQKAIEDARPQAGGVEHEELTPEQRIAAETAAKAALGLPANATVDDVKRAYKQLVRKFHPDKAGNDLDREQNALRIRVINKAMEELRNLMRF